ncbi:hypothetical protein HYQ45_013869 [Verticillium longisporum]|uniref:Uncharacterized protein n=1 Tax=Verticillium longisporum TaxID=100787 RepID=A0A8I3AMB9_VERLO|nr:hypothetical protein VdG1_03854 [Verticillium dahliae VDG1]KAG7123380.1 hypothetical protein HYQ45_013869 [Verticillium longisporum]RBQ92910.1 hypothetical protein VDGD_08320 [Verticillium dahliae]
MPCCLAFLSYGGCDHKQLWKIHCTSDCSSVICAPSEQEVMAHIHYKWRCEECHTRHWDTNERRRAERAEDDERAILQDDDLPDQQKNLFLDSYRFREDWVDRRVEKSRTEQVEEIQWVVEFAEEYGRIMWALKYGPDDDLTRLHKRMDYLLDVKFWDVTIVRDIRGEDSVTTRSRASSATLVDESCAGTLDDQPTMKEQLDLKQHPAKLYHVDPSIVSEADAPYEAHQAAAGA